MKTSIEKNIQRIKRFNLTCTLNDNGHLRHFHNGHEYVEIGGIKWAVCNVGAEKPTESGLYFACGDTQGFTAEQVMNGERYFGWADYKYCNGTYSVMTKYNSTDGKTVLEANDDAAHANWGGAWRMPTETEFQALRAAVNTAWTADYQGSGVAGLVCTDKTDSSKVLFFPAVGYCYNGSVFSVGSYGLYWLSSLNSLDTSHARGKYFNCGYVGWDYDSDRSNGFAVRGVVAK